MRLRNFLDNWFLLVPLLAMFVCGFGLGRLVGIKEGQSDKEFWKVTSKEWEANYNHCLALQLGIVLTLLATYILLWMLLK